MDIVLCSLCDLAYYMLLLCCQNEVLQREKRMPGAEHCFIGENKGGNEDDHIMYGDSSVWSVVLKIQMIKIKLYVYYLLLKIHSVLIADLLQIKRHLWK